LGFIYFEEIYTDTLTELNCLHLQLRNLYIEISFLPESKV